MPRFSDDDVLDFQVREAVLARFNADMKKIERDRAAEAHRKDHRSLAKQGR